MITIAITAIVDQIENFPIVVAMGPPLSQQKVQGLSQIELDSYCTWVTRPTNIVVSTHY